MIILYSKETSPYINIALEEQLLKNYDTNEDILFFWQNHNAIIVGRNQNAAAEINTDFVKKNNISVVRRLSGGGSVYHDTGNVNFTFITNYEKNKVQDYARFCQPIIEFLNSIGVNAEFSGRNDIVVDDKKISGNSQLIFEDRFMHHGTLLFDADFSMLVNALNVDELKFKDKAVKSVRKRVANIKEFTNSDITSNDFLKSLIDYFSKKYDTTAFEVENKYLEKAKASSEEKYMKYEWNFGKSPIFSFENKVKYDGGILQTYLEIKNGIVEDIKFYGDFLSNLDQDEIVDNFKGIKFTKEDFEKVLGNIEIEKYFGTITKENIIDNIFNYQGE